MKCGVKGCKDEAYDLLLIVSRFGAKQPHMGIWGGVWLCQKHLEELDEKLKEIGVAETPKLSGLTPIPSELGLPLKPPLLEDKK